MDDFGRLLGERIRSFRKRKGLSQEELAHRATFSTSFISDIERGIKSPTMESMYKITTALDISLEELFIKFQPIKKTPEGELVDSIIRKVNNLPMKELQSVNSILELLVNFRAR